MLGVWYFHLNKAVIAQTFIEESRNEIVQRLLSLALLRFFCHLSIQL